MIRRHTFLFFGAIALLGVSPAFAADGYGARSPVRLPIARSNINYGKYQVMPSTAQGQAYINHNANPYAVNVRQTAPKTRTEVVRRQVKRKYYLAHPFFQPLKGKFGSITDFSYDMNSYNLEIDPVGSTITDSSAKWRADRFSIKEDFSYGITDRLAVLGMLKFDTTKYKLDWSVSQDDTMRDTGLNLFGAGLQWRFVDTTNWIATLSGYYEYQDDISNDFILDLKAGYKVASTTFYGLVRGWYANFKSNSYGDKMDGKTTSGENVSIFLAYNELNTDNVFYIEGGLGAYSIASEDWILNLEAIFGYYDWHNQLSLKGAIGWQPNDWFALNLYGKVSLYDSADDKSVSFWYKNDPYPNWQKGGTAKLDDYLEASAGVQVIFMF